MANKTIFELPALAEIAGDEVLPVDDGVETFKVTLPVLLAYLEANIDVPTSPVGTVTAFAGASAPAGYLICNGAAVSRTTYADLFAVVATTYGVGDGTTTFNIPELRGEFIRGLDASRGIDAARALGSAQASQIGNHTHAAGTLANTTENAPHGHPGSTSSTENAPHGHPALTIVAANAPHTHPLTIASANAPHTHPVGIPPVPLLYGNAATAGPGSAIGILSGGPGPSPTTLQARDANAPHSHPGSTADAANAPHTHTGSADAANAPHSHTLTIATGTAPHSHTLSGSVDYFGGTGNPVSPAPTPAPTVQGETRPRNVAMNYIIKY